MERAFILMLYVCVQRAGAAAGYHLPSYRPGVAPNSPSGITWTQAVDVKNGEAKIHLHRPDRSEC